MALYDNGSYYLLLEIIPYFQRPEEYCLLANCDFSILFRCVTPYNFTKLKQNAHQTITQLTLPNPTNLNKTSY